jgi:hypothetical protein
MFEVSKARCSLLCRVGFEIRSSEHPFATLRVRFLLQRTARFGETRRGRIVLLGLARIQRNAPTGSICCSTTTCAASSSIYLKNISYSCHTSHVESAALLLEPLYSIALHVVGSLPPYHAQFMFTQSSGTTSETNTKQKESGTPYRSHVGIEFLPLLREVY